MVHINLIIINNLLISLVGCLHFNIFLCLITTTNLHHLAVPVVASWLHCREQSQSSCLLYQARRLACWRLMGLMKVVTFGFSSWWALADRLLARSTSFLVLEKIGSYNFFTLWFYKLHAFFIFIFSLPWRIYLFFFTSLFT